MAADSPNTVSGVAMKAAMALFGISLGIAMMYYPKAEPFLHPHGFQELDTIQAGRFEIIDKPTRFTLESKYDKSYRVVLRFDDCKEIYNKDHIDFGRKVYNITSAVKLGDRIIASKTYDSRYPLSRPDSPECNIVLIEFDGNRGESYEVGFLFRALQEGTKEMDRLHKRLWVEESYPDVAADSARVLLISGALCAASLLFIVARILLTLFAGRRSGGGVK